MAVVVRKTGKRKVFWIAFYTNERDASGKRVQEWERVGTDKREAEAMDRQRKKEVETGTYAKGRRPTMPFGEWVKEWLGKRTNRNARDDAKVVTRFLLSPERAWLTSLPCEDLRPRHSVQLVEELKATVSEETDKVVSEKYVSNIYGLYATACRDAQIAELMHVDPCVLPYGLIRRKAKRNARSTYELEEIVSLSACPDDEALVFSMLSLLTGEREGETCGRRWRDWDKHSMPLGCLDVNSQYDDQPLKTDKGETGEHARKVPVHPALARLLEWWWSHGFEFTYCRKPTRDDFIVPRTLDGKPHTRSSAYKLWRKACDLSKVSNRSLHSTRHTFITLCRRGGARQEVVERVTHNAAGTQVDHYTHWDWAPLCEAVLCLKLPIDSNLDQTPGLPGKRLRDEWRRWESKCAPEALEAGISGHSKEDNGTPEGLDFPKLPAGAASHCAGQETPTPPPWLHEAVANLALLRLSALQEASR